MTTDRNILDETADAYAELQRDPERWQEELNERAEWDVTLADGLEDEDMTTTRDGDVLSEEQLDRIWERLSVLSDVERTNQILTDLLALSRHTEALQQRLDAAEQRMERLVECVTAYADPDNWRDESWGKFCEEPEPVCHLGSYYARTALAALTEQEPTDA